MILGIAVKVGAAVIALIWLYLVIAASVVILRDRELTAFTRTLRRRCGR